MSLKTIRINDYISLTISDALNNTHSEKYQMIYFDPPFNSDRIYKLSEDDDLGFKDKWTDEEYRIFISQHIDKLYDLLTYNLNINDCIYYIIDNLITKKNLHHNFIDNIFLKTCFFFRYYDFTFIHTCC